MIVSRDINPKRDFVQSFIVLEQLIQDVERASEILYDVEGWLALKNDSIGFFEKILFVPKMDRKGHIFVFFLRLLH